MAAPPVRESVRDYARSAYREAILDAAESVFLRDGYNQAKMAEVASAAGVAIGTLYNHFESKELVFSSLLERGRKQFLGAVESVPPASSPLGQIRNTVTAVTEFIQSHSDLFALYTQLGALTESDIRRVGGEDAEAGYLAYLEVLQNAIARAQQDGCLRHDIPAELAASALAGMVNASVFRWLRSGRRDTLTQQVEPTLMLFFEGTRAR